MKKIPTITLVLSLVLSVFSCGGTSSSDHSVHPAGFGFSLPDRRCNLADPDVFPALPGACSQEDLYPSEWGRTWSSNNIDNANNVNNVNNYNNVNNTNNDTPTERIFEEADLIRVDGNLLYALSAHRGLVVVDLADPAAPSLLGGFPVFGTPFEMHLRDGVAFVQFSAFWHYVYEAETGDGRFQVTSRVVALDVSDPADIRELSTFDLPGEIGDSRLAGDILYVVSSQNGACDGCNMVNGLSVMSLDVSNPGQPIEIDRQELAWPDAMSFSRRPVHFSSQRIFIGGLPVDDHSSAIQVIDISDPSGWMASGARVTVQGQITNRWQMDEREGVLRAVSQSLDWERPPVVHTFGIVSSTELVPLDQLELEMDEPEQLRSVRFDGATAYIITILPQPVFETEDWAMDPLFIVDCSNPESLVQQGYFSMPGWVYFIEPRGDRLITLGLANDDGGVLTLSLFDVSDPWNPVETVRNVFGSWSTEMAEDQSRIHKAMQVLDDRGLILVPFGNRTAQITQGEVAIFAFDRDSITPLYNLETAGLARRAFFQEDHLLVVGSERISSFDMSEPGLPVAAGVLDLVTPVYLSTIVDDALVARLVENPWTGTARVEIYDLADTGFTNPLSTMDVEGEDPNSHLTWGLLWQDIQSSTRLFARGRTLHLLYRRSSMNDFNFQLWLKSFDLTDPADPQLLAESFLPGPLSPRSSRRTNHLTVESGESALMLHDFLVYLRWTGSNSPITVVDLRDPTTPLRHTFVIPGSGTWTFSHSSTMIASGDHVYLSRFEPSQQRGVHETGDWVDYRLLDLDLSNPDVPQLVEIGVIPGTLVGVTPSRDRIVTIDYTRVLVGGMDQDTCMGSSTYPMYDDLLGLCYRIAHTLKVSRFDDPMGGILAEIPLGQRWVRDVQVTQTRLFFTSYDEPVYRGLPSDAPVGRIERRPRLHAISLQDNASWEVTAEVDLPHPYAFLYYAHGDHAVVAADAPPMLLHLRNPHPGVFEDASELPMGGYLYDITRSDDGLVLSLGPRGSFTIEDLP